MSKQWIVVIPVGAIGAAVEWMELHNSAHSENIPLIVQALGWPGAILSLPIYILGGGVHGRGADLWVYSLVPVNALAYGLITYLVFKLVRRFKPKAV